MDIADLLRTSRKTQYKVKVSDGNRCRTYDVTEVVGYTDGFALRYKDGQGNQDVVYMARTYRPVVEDGFYMVGKRLGNNSAAVVVDGKQLAVGCDVVGRSTDSDCPGEDLSAIVRSDGLAIGYKALYESKIPWKMIVIFGIVAFVILAIIMFMRTRGA